MNLRIQGRLGHRAPPPPPAPPSAPVKSNSYTPKIQTIFTLMLSRATKAIEWSSRRWRADDGPLLWYLDPLSPHQLKRHEIILTSMMYKQLSACTLLLCDVK